MLTTLRLRFPALLACLLAGCSFDSPPRGSELTPWVFACTHEKERARVPDPDADLLYRHARSLEDINRQRTYSASDPEGVARIARYYRIAAAHGHDQANLALINFLWRVTDSAYSNVSTPFRAQREEETRRLVQQLVDRNVPAGFLALGGQAAQDWNLQLAMTHFRRAADLGSPDAQFKAAELLDEDSTSGAAARFSLPDKKKLVMSLYQCSAGQGHREAIHAVAEKLHARGQLDEAMKTFQQGVIAGDAASAYALKSLFTEFEAQHTLKPNLWKKDEERGRRYEKLRVFLIDKQYQHIRILDLDRIVPLPPAPLPPWDGDIRWTSDDLNAPAASKPSESLVIRLADQKGLDPRTGLVRQD